MTPGSEIAVLWENFVDRTESYDLFDTKSYIFLAHENTCTVWGIFLPSQALTTRLKEFCSDSQEECDREKEAFDGPSPATSAGKGKLSAQGAYLPRLRPSLHTLPAAPRAGPTRPQRRRTRLPPSHSGSHGAGLPADTWKHPGLFTARKNSPGRATTPSTPQNGHLPNRHSRPQEASKPSETSILEAAKARRTTLHGPRPNRRLPRPGDASLRVHRTGARSQIPDRAQGGVRRATGAARRTDRRNGRLPGLLIYRKKANSSS